MQNKLYTQIIDYSVLLIALFILFFCWIRFYSHQIILSIITGFLLSTITTFIIYKFISKKQSLKNISLNKQKQISNLANQLSFCNTKQILDFFETQFQQSNYNVSKQKQYLLLNNDTIFYPCFHVNNFEIQDLKNIMAKLQNKQKNIILCTQYYAQNAQKLVKNIKNYNISLLSIDELYNSILCNSTFQIPSIIDTNQPKIKIKDIFSQMFCKQKSKTYLFFSALLLLYSFYLPYKIYYLIFGSLLLILSILSRFSNLNKSLSK